MGGSTSAVVEALNGEMTWLTGTKSPATIKVKKVAQKPSMPAGLCCLVGLKEVKLPSSVGVRFLYQPGELESGRLRATDLVWSLGVYRVGRTVTKTNEPGLYYLGVCP